VSLALTAKEGSNRLFSDVRTFDVGRPLPEIVRGLNDYQPHSLGGYAAALKVLAEAQERGDLHIRPDHLSNGGEPLLPTVKAYVERVFKAPIVNVYASSEHLIMGLTLPRTSGLHLLEDDLIFELHEDQTCVTNLFNETMPLIRYRMDDVLQPEVNEAPRYPFTRVKEVVGRYEDALVFTNRHGRDDFIHPIVIVELIVPGLDAWQVVLVDKTTFRFRARYEARVTVEQRAGVRERIRTTLDAILAAKEMDNVRFDIEDVETLAADPRSGKFRMVVRHTGSTAAAM